MYWLPRILFYIPKVIEIDFERLYKQGSYLDTNIGWIMFGDLGQVRSKESFDVIASPKI